MEAFIIIVIVIALCFILGVSIETILAGVMFLLAAVLLLITVFFVLCAAKLFDSKACKAEFVKIAKSPKGNFDAAYYAIDENEYPNVLPCEIIMRNRLYKMNRTVNVRLTKDRKFVFDKNAVAATAVGIIFGTISTTGVLFAAIQYI